MRQLFILLLVVLATPAVTLAQDVPAWLADARLEEERRADVPRGTRVRGFGARRVGTSRDGQAVYRWIDGEVWETRLVGATLPRGARLVPIVELDTILFASFAPASYAVLVPASSETWFFNAYSGAVEALSLESAVAGMSTRRAFAATVALRAMRSCPRSRRRCALYGPARDIARARDPDEPMGGFFLRAQPIQSAPAGVTYRTERFTTSLSGVELRHDTGRGPSNEWVSRMFLVVGGHEHPAFTSIHDAGLLGVSRASVTAMGSHIYVYDYAGRVSVHDRRTGRRLSELGAVHYEPYYDICLAGDDGIFVIPVFGGAQVGYALTFYNVERGTYYTDLSRSPESVLLEDEEITDFTGAAPHLRVSAAGLRYTSASATSPR